MRRAQKFFLHAKTFGKGDFFMKMSSKMKHSAGKGDFFLLHGNVISKMQRSQILHFSGDILKLYFIPEQFVPNVNNLSTPGF